MLQVGPAYRRARAAVYRSHACVRGGRVGKGGPAPWLLLRCARSQVLRLSEGLWGACRLWRRERTCTGACRALQAVISEVDPAELGQRMVLDQAVVDSPVHQVLSILHFLLNPRDRGTGQQGQLT